MVFKVLFQGLALLVLFQSLLYIVFRLNFGSGDCLPPTSRFLGSVVVYCDKCQLNVNASEADDFSLMNGLVLTKENKGRDTTAVHDLNVDTGTLIKNSVDYVINKEDTLPMIYRKNVLVGLKDIKKSVNHVFFVESRCGTSKLAREFNSSFDFVLSARQSCSVESTARTNPSRDIYIVHSCPLSDDFLSRAPDYVSKLLQLQNVHIVRINLTELFQDSPVQQLFESDRMDESEWPVVHASDVIRVLLLWKFGGTYHDLDVISMRPLDKLGTNFAGFQDASSINNAVLNFEPFGLGNKVSTKVLQHLNNNFNGRQWGANGPDVITKILKTECEIAPDICSDTFTVFHPSVFYPVYYPGYKRFFDPDQSENLVQDIRATAFTVHFWNKISKDLVVQVGSNQTYALLADESCPGVYRNCGPTF